MDRIRLYIGLLALTMAMACNVTRVVKPLEKSEHSVGAGFGGAGIVYAGAPMPIPNLNVQYAYGLDTGLTLTSGVHITSAAFGVAHADVGLAIRAYENDSSTFGITIAPAMHTLYEFRESAFRLYPQLDALAWWQYGQKPHLIYGGMGTWIELHREKAHDAVQQNEVLPWITLGHQLNRGTWNFTTEFRYMGFQHETKYLVADYISPGGRGSLGFFLGISKSLGR